MTSEEQVRASIVRLAKSLFDRGFSVGSAGNISCAVEDGILITPTNSSLGSLNPDRISKIGRDGRHISGDKPSKEVFLHRAFYESRPSTGAVVHLHSTYCTALSCLADVDPDDCIPPLTPYVIMRVGQVPILPYVRPGDQKAGKLIDDLGGRFAAVLLANHGPVVAGRDLESAVFAAEELEETAKLLILLRSMKLRYLTDAQVEELGTVFGKP
ncbi:MULTISPECIES: 3-oxo-tetronate 4-phosphate decarboxylase [unclassified Mesorhizobium]|uniref:3-oxo-tetronate 4-phosphate decarboxylase n=1 Tax=unclassified Mesorhizobium TaxID=325217 RepID=UPI000FD6E27C|nr:MULTISPECIES: 3-oxo-tetronate 4-phosphate decarboxylase [unclassified Mesorhizobium]TGR43692.1 aldolase [bacterium M00.F.Ca.ET.199.01.1.1]TGU40303.1 aldolase [bacterium M00.F.Ca.ET.156.01.1.1]TGV86843.1 aldolase [Mesorhizobium sp. M00.F.Ca.ET.149.01.1.1]TGR28023.1 aldolase [Mesorhizobium sp. M8A.F.Ca.ET.197.01.1.1]TGR32426.1 aldolase [Mesorhizobium sp. M8A.F.Ca.ET.202.01.1.1]